MKKSRRVKNILWIVSAVIAVAMMIIAEMMIKDRIEDAKLTAREAADQIRQESKKQEIDGIRFYVNDSIGKNDITWRMEVLEAVPPKESMGWLKEKSHRAGTSDSRSMAFLLMKLSLLIIY